MGMFQVNVTVANPRDASRSFQEKFWVDTGAFYTFIPEDRLSEIGITTIRARDLILADGRTERCMLGEAVLTVSELEESLTCPVVFAPAGSELVLGSLTLACFGLAADPPHEALISVPGRL